MIITCDNRTEQDCINFSNSNKPLLLMEYNEREKRELVAIHEETIRLAELARDYTTSDEI